MCGIAGFAGWPGSAGAEELQRMCDLIWHRGPDEAGYLARPEVALGMRRLSIIDLGGGTQPIGNEDGSVQVVFNGEIYNYRELREMLLHAGHRFRTGSDTEVIVHLYEEVGDRLVEELRGMFAFALWDERRERLLVARDRLGIKPLYYWERAGGMAFGSELKSLRCLEGFPEELDPAAVAEYLALGYVPEPRSIFMGVKKLPPGYTLSWERARGVELKRYWTPIREESAQITRDEAVEEIRRLLSESVRYRLVADVPLGAFLSGGIDSSAVVAEMSRQMDRPVKTFSIGFDEHEYNEAPDAAAVARELGTDHTELVVRPEVEEWLEDLVLAFDEPFADSSAIPTLLVSRLARREVTVVLSGDGGDELFGGYRRYLEYQQRDFRLPAPVRRVLATTARSLPTSAWGRRRLLEHSRTPAGRYAELISFPLDIREGGVARPEVAARGGSMDALLSRWFEEAAGRDQVTQATFVDLLSYLPGDILSKVDRMSMAASLEARVPLLDHKLVEFAAGLPAWMKLRGGVGKWIFREAVRGLVPDFVLDKPKHGFSLPVRRWLRQELRHRLDDLMRPDSAVYAFVDRSAVCMVVQEHLTERRNRAGLLWRLLVLDLWLRARNRAIGHSARLGESALAAR